jgi:hypothetical protein
MWGFEVGILVDADWDGIRKIAWINDLGWREEVTWRMYTVCTALT